MDISNIATRELIRMALDGEIPPEIMASTKNSIFERLEEVGEELVKAETIHETNEKLVKEIDELKKNIPTDEPAPCNIEENKEYQLALETNENLSGQVRTLKEELQKSGIKYDTKKEECIRLSAELLSANMKLLL